MTPEGLAGTGIGGRTPLTGWGGVQIENLGRIGRHLRTGRRPDSWWLLIWTPVGCRRGVQIWGSRLVATAIFDWRPLQTY